MTEEIQKNFDTAHNKVTSILSDYITGGYADTFAKLLIYMGKAKAQETIQKLSEPVKSKVLESYKNHSQKKITDPDIISAAGHVLKEADFFGEAMSSAVSQGLDTKLLTELSRQTDVLFDQDPLIALNLEQHLFTFEDITMLDDRAIQKVLREVDAQELAKALKSVDREVQDKIFCNMSKRAASMLREDMEYLGPVLLKDIAEAQQKIISTICRLEDAGEIVIAKSDTLV